MFDTSPRVLQYGAHLYLKFSVPYLRLAFRTLGQRAYVVQRKITKTICLDESDGWTIYTYDDSLSAQWEYTLLMTETGVEILSK